MFRKVLIIAGLILHMQTSMAGGDVLGKALQLLDSGRPAEASDLLQPLASQGNAVAQYQLGLIHYYGQGVPEDEKQAIHWWKQAAAQGSAEAMYQLGSAYLYGSQASGFVPDPDREAAIWYFQAASKGHAEAQYHLGLLFLAGKGVVENRQEAARWLRKAAAQKHQEAKKALLYIQPKSKR